MFPQIILNYRKKSGEGASLTMMIAWVIGDICNITGALMQGLVASTIMIGAYYMFVDSTLLIQTVYYRIVYKAHLKIDGSNDQEGTSSTDTDPLINSNGNQQQQEQQYQDITTSNNDNDVNATDESNSHETEASLATSSWFMNGSSWWRRMPSILSVVLSIASLGCLFVVLGVLLLAPRTTGPDKDTSNGSNSPIPFSQLFAQAMGTSSAIIYIMSYVPQAVQNYQRKSCEGLSIWLFLLSLMGNTTYALAIIAVSLDPHYLAPYVPWLLGALVPCVIQVYILYQFHVYPH